jgi:hypothetical protein
MATGNYRVGTFKCLHIVALASTVLAMGCFGSPSIFRNQSPEPSFENLESDSPTLVGELAIPTGMNYTMVRGVGLITGLDDTGGNPRPSAYKDRLLDEMAIYDVDDPNGILALKSTALVVVHGYLPPGIRRGQRFDLFVSSSNRSDTTSLKKGRLMASRLKTVAVLDDAIREGHVDAQGGGYVLVDSVFANSDDDKLQQRGRILGGGVVKTDRSLGLRVRDAKSSVVASTVISNAINQRFSHFVGNQRKGVAVPKTPAHIELSVPFKYRNNVQRYMRVVRAIPVRLSTSDRSILLNELREELLEPTSTAQAALKLEALGKDAISVLQQGVQSDDVEVRFYAAEALAYLDDQTVAPILAQIAAQERAFRAHGLTALSAMEHVSSYESLTQLLNNPSAETRYGAFRAMKARNARDPMVRGDVLDDRLILHELPAGGEPMIHFANSRSPEIVVFGGQQRLHTPNFLFVGAKMMIKRMDEERVRVIRYTAGQDDEEIVTSNQLGDVIRAIVELGGGYEEAYQACRSAKLTGKLDARLEVDSQARASRQFDREAESRFRAANPTPGLFRNDPKQADEGRKRYDDGDITPEAEPGFFGKMKNWASRDEADE